MTMKKTLTALLCAAAVLSFTGCNESGKNNYTPAPDPTPTETSTSTEPVEAEPEENDDEQILGEGFYGIVEDNKGGFRLKTLEEEKAEREAADKAKAEAEEAAKKKLEEADKAAQGGSSNSSSSSSTPSSSSKSSSSSASASLDDLMAAASVSGAISDIKAVCGLKSTVETSIPDCIVNVTTSHNPYDVAYDYGKGYDAFVDACDWSLVFDADYYIKQFPMLALQYNYDKALLLEHFQTVGVHEGRQGNAAFNVGTYRNNCSNNVRSAFGDNWEGYYFYYMLNNSTEKSVNTTGGSKQQKTVMTALQAQQLSDINGYRAEVGQPALTFNSELAAFANYRCIVNHNTGMIAHEWIDATEGRNFIINKLLPTLKGAGYNENTCRWDNTKRTYGETHSTCYRNSEDHYKTLIGNYDIYGISNSYRSNTTRTVIQLDAFVRLA